MDIIYIALGLIGSFALWLLVAYLNGECVCQPFWFKANRNIGIRVSKIVADSRMIMRGIAPNVEWLSPDRTWTRNVFDAARFELNQKDKLQAWLKRELENSPY